MYLIIKPIGFFIKPQPSISCKFYFVSVFLAFLVGVSKFVCGLTDQVQDKTTRLVSGTIIDS